MKIKKLFAALMAITFIGGAVFTAPQYAADYSLTASAEVDYDGNEYTEGTYESLTYKMYSDHIEISYCDDTTKGEIVIPDEIEGLPVTVIGSHAFMGCQKITSVIIPDSVTVIESGAFFDCSSLRSIEIPDSVTTIEEWAFANCISLEEIKLSGSLEGIRFRTFIGCTSLQNITLPDSITKIEEDAFADCTSLISITIPANVKSIEDKAFAFCTNLESITILNPDCIIRDEGNGTTIYNNFIDDSSYDVYFDGVIIGYANSGAQAYAEKYGYKFEVIGEAPEEPEYTEGELGIIKYRKYSDHIEITNGGLEIPEEIEGLPVTVIASRAFYQHLTLTEITIPKTVTKIGSWAFSFCRDLQKVTILNPDCEIFDDNNTFFNVINNEMYGFFNGTIYGYEGSTAQAYAEKYSRKFESLGEAPEEPEYKLGDPNADGLIDAVDASYILALYAKSSTNDKAPTEYEWLTCDVNKDGLIDSVDASIVLAYYSHTSTGGTLSLEEFMKNN